MATKVPELPKWSKRVHTELSGRDPLGLSRISFLLADFLLPGIITTTNRARYYAIYCWIIRNIEEVEHIEDYDDFVSAFQRREAAFALGTLLNASALSPIGITVAETRLNDADEHFPLAFQLLSSSSLGGFSQNYGGCMFDLGLVEYDPNGVPRIRAATALALADAVEESLSPTAFFQKRLYTQSEVDRTTLENAAPQLDLAWLGDPGGRPERDLTIDLLFREDRQGDAVSSNRRESLVLILEALRQTEAAGGEVAVGDAELHLLYRTTYYAEVLSAADESLVEFVVPDAQMRTVEHWRMFCAHQYLTQALELVLHAILEVLEVDPGGFTESAIVSELAGNELEALFESFELSAASPRALFSSLGVDKVPTAHPGVVWTTFDARSEAQLCAAEYSGPQQACGVAVSLLGVLYRRWRALPDDDGVQQLRRSAAGTLWLGSVLPLLDSWFDDSWEAALTTLVQLALRHHDKVMYVKGRLDSCWLHREGDKWIKDQDLEPSFRSPRILQAIHMLTDLGAISENGDDGILGLTALGRTVLEQHMEARGG